jgi:hypothetical protein
MHGSLTVQSALGRGSAFTLRLPREENGASHATTTDATTSRGAATDGASPRSASLDGTRPRIAPNDGARTRRAPATQ